MSYINHSSECFFVGGCSLKFIQLIMVSFKFHLVKLISVDSAIYFPIICYSITSKVCVCVCVCVCPVNIAERELNYLTLNLKAD